MKSFSPCAFVWHDGETVEAIVLWLELPRAAGSAKKSESDSAPAKCEAAS